MKWVTMWGNAQSTVVPNPAKYAKDLTLRYPIFVPFNGSKIRITLDNFTVNEKVKIDSVAISVTNTFDDNVAETIFLTFDGKKEAEINAHESIISDELNISLKENTYLIISMYLKDYTNLTGGVDIIGPLSKGYFAYGNQIDKKFDIKTSKQTSWVYFLSNVDIYTEDTNSAIICYGDSITSQDWPDYMLLALRKNGVKNYSVIRKAVSGTRILREYDCITYQSYGLKGSNRFIHEISSVFGASKIIIQHGINDIIHPVGSDINPFRPMSDLPTLDELIAGINYYIDYAKSLNLEIFIGTLLPIFNWRTYASFRENLKNDFNSWIRKLNVIDFENEVGFNDNGIWKFKDLCDSGDHLHPSKFAYDLMGNLAYKVIFKI